jgi:hypothetical protein
MTKKSVNLLAVAVALMSFTSPSTAAVRYTEARITQVETSDMGIYVFLSVVSGDLPPTGNGGSNEPLTKYYLMLANSVETIAARKHLLASALVGLTNGATVRLRWDDEGTNAYLVTHMLVRE